MQRFLKCFDDKSCSPLTLLVFLEKLADDPKNNMQLLKFTQVVTASGKVCLVNVEEQQVGD